MPSVAHKRKRGVDVDEHGIIDINRYLSRPGQDPGRAFAIWGGDGDQARFALPVWRTIYLLGGERGGVLWVPTAKGSDPQPLFVLDLGQDPARTEFPVGPLNNLETKEPPALAFDREGGVVVFLGEEKEKRWFLSIWGKEIISPPKGKTREDLLFLAGECAGLLFFRELSTDP